jgi:hypothetical protein
MHVHTTRPAFGRRAACGPAQCDLCTLVEWPARDQSPEGIAEHLRDQAKRWYHKAGRLHRYDYDSAEEMAADADAYRARARRANALAKEAEAGAFSAAYAPPPPVPERVRRERALLAALEAIPADADGWHQAGLYQLAEAIGPPNSLVPQQVMQVRDRLVKAGIIEYRTVPTTRRGARIGAYRIIPQGGAQ